MPQLVLDIDCDGHKCGNCRWLEHDVCRLFEVWLGDVKIDRTFMRCLACELHEKREARLMFETTSGTENTSKSATYKILNVYKIGV